MLTKIISATHETYLLYASIEGADFKSLGLWKKPDIMEKFKITEQQFKKLCK